MTLMRLRSVRITDAARFSLTPQGCAALAAASTCAGCPQCGLPLADVTGMNSSFYECSEPDCYFEQAGRDVQALEAAP